jgi:uncharacterized protein YcbK (DUF882 family)
MFVTPDSIVPNLFDPQMLNRYAYCRNNPLVYTDPSGHTVEGIGSGDYYSEKNIKDRYNDMVKEAERANWESKLANVRMGIFGTEEMTLTEATKYAGKKISIDYSPMELEYKRNQKLSNPKVVEVVKELGKKLNAEKAIVSSGDRTAEEQNILREADPSLPLPENDQHCKNKAADVKFVKDGKQVPTSEVANIAAEISQIGGIGTYNDPYSFNHIDIRSRLSNGQPTTWNGDKKKK